MDHLKFAQYAHMSNEEKMRAKRLELLEHIDVNYCVPCIPPAMRDFYQRMFPGYTILHAAVAKSETDLVHELIDRGADILKQGSEDGISPIHLAFNDILRTNKSIRAIWAEPRQREFIKVLLSIHVTKNNTFNPKCKDGLSHFHIACCVDHTDAVDFFLKAGEPVDQIIEWRAHSLGGFTPLHCAIKFSSIKAIEILLSHGADVKLKNFKGKSPIHLMVDRLINVIEWKTIGKRTLRCDFENELEEIKLMIDLFIKTKIVYNENFTDDVGFTAFHFLCIAEELSILEEFLAKGAGIDRPVNSNSEFWAEWTPLHFAACSSIETFKFLMKNGANVNAKNAQGETPLDFCITRFTPTVLHSTLSMEEKFNSIMLSDGSTRFLDLLIAMNDKDSFAKFLQNLSDVNIKVATDSPVWPGHSLLHLSVAMNEKTRRGIYQRGGVLRPTDQFPDDEHNCTKSEEAIYLKRIGMCLARGCSVSVKNTEDLSPIHLAFKLSRTVALDMMLNKCEEDAVDPNNLSHLHIACLANKMDLVERLLSRGSNVNSPMGRSVDWHKASVGVWPPAPSKISFEARSTPLHIAVVLENAAMVECLLQRGADVHARDELERTPIHRSMEATHFGPMIAQQLIRATIENLTNSISSRDGLSHLHVAAFADEQQAVGKLLREGAPVDCMVEMNGGPFAGETPLHVAVKAGSANAASSLVRGGANVHLEHPARKFSSPLQYAMNHYKHPIMACIFLKIAADCRGVGTLDDSGVTLLHLACTLGLYDIAKRLLELGADPNAQVRRDEEYVGKWRGKRPLHTMVSEAATAGICSDVVRMAMLLLTSGADPIADDGESTTPLHVVIDIIRENHFSFNLTDRAENADELNQLLLAVGDVFLKHQKSYDVNPVGGHGISYFHYACSRNDVDVMKKFLDSGVNVNEPISPFASDKAGETPLHFALENRQREAALFLIKNGADVKAEDARGNTPLHALFQNSMDLEVADALLDQGANISAKNFSLQTPLARILGRHTLTLDSFLWFLNRGYKIDFFEPGEFNHGIIAELMESINPDEFLSILKTLFETCDLKKAIGQGFNPICSLVSIHRPSQFKVEHYLEAVEQLMDMGFDIDWKSKEGKTALSDAIDFYNVEAVKSLLLLGADLNVANPLSIFMFSLNELQSIGLSDKMEVAKVVADHVWKAKLVSLKLCEHVDQSETRSFEKLFPLDDETRQGFYDEIIEMENTRISDDVSVKDFLSDLGAVAAYPRMLAAQRLAVDEFFKSRAELREKFPEYCGLLLVQYKKLLARLELLDPARNALHDLFPIKLPDLCIEAILRYLTNDELEILVQI